MKLTIITFLFFFSWFLQGMFYCAFRLNFMLNYCDQFYVLILILLYVFTLIVCYISILQTITMTLKRLKEIKNERM